MAALHCTIKRRATKEQHSRQWLLTPEGHGVQGEKRGIANLGTNVICLQDVRVVLNTRQGQICSQRLLGKPALVSDCTVEQHK